MLDDQEKHMIQGCLQIPQLVLKARNASLFPEELEKELNGIKVPLVLLRDAAYIVT